MPIMRLNDDGAILPERKGRLIAWCPECQTWLGPEEIGQECPFQGHETRTGKRKLLKRRRYVCPGAKAFFAEHVYREHMANECAGPGGFCP